MSRLAPFLRRVEDLLDFEKAEAAPQRKALYIFILRLVGALIAYVFQILLARWLGAHEFGIFVVVWTWIILFSTLVALGFDSAVIRLIPEYDEAGDQPALRGVLAASRLVTLVGSTLLVLVAIAGVWFFSDFVTRHYVVPLYLGLACLPLMALMNVQDGIAKAYDWFDVGLIPTYIARPLAILGFVALAGALAEEQTAEWALTAAIGGTYLVALGQYVALRRRLGRDLTHGSKRYDLTGWLKISLPILAFDGFFVMLTSTDVLVASYFVEPGEVAVYHVALKTLAIAHFVFFAIRSVAGHRFSRLYHSGDEAGLARFAALSVQLSFWPTLVICAALLAGGDLILRLFGDFYRSGYPIMAVLAVGIVVRAAIGPAASLLTMSGHQNLCARVYAVTFLLNLTLNIFAIMQFGLIGAAVATSLSLVFETLAVQRAVKLKLGLTLSVLAPKARGGFRGWQPSKVPPATLAAWRDLHASSDSATALNTPEGLIPALSAFGGKSARVLPLAGPAFSPAPSSPFTGPLTGPLTGLVGVHQVAPLRGMTGSLPALWSSAFGPLGAPLVRSGQETQFLQALFEETGAAAILLPDQYLDSDSWSRLAAAATEAGTHVRVIDHWQRAVLHARAPLPLASPMSGRHQKERRRLWRRLGEQGEVRLETARTTATLAAATARFLPLEARGWKGAARTALASTEARQSFVTQLLAGFEQQGGLTIDELRVDDRSIASVIMLTAERHAVTWKIAFDPDFAKFSPGLLLMSEVTNRLLDEARFDLVDSLATPNHPMIDRLWPDKARIGQVLLAKSSLMGTLRTAEFQAKTKAKAVVKQILRRQVTGGK